MFGRLDLKTVECPYCHGSGKSQKNRKQPCQECNGSGTVQVCKSCGGIYGKECVDKYVDQSYCERRKDDKLTQGLILMHGVTAAGKSDLAKVLASYLDCERICTSKIKHARGWRGIQHGDNRRDLVYVSIQDMLSTKFGFGEEIVVIDGTYAKRHWRQGIYHICDQLNIPIAIIHCVCEDEIEVKRRIDDRYDKNPKSPHSEASDFSYFDTEKRYIEELLVDKFPRPEMVGIIAFDTHRMVINHVSLAGTHKFSCFVERALKQVLIMGLYPSKNAK